MCLVLLKKNLSIIDQHLAKKKKNGVWAVMLKGKIMPSNMTDFLVQGAYSFENFGTSSPFNFYHQP